MCYYHDSVRMLLPERATPKNCLALAATIPTFIVPSDLAPINTALARAPTCGPERHSFSVDLDPTTQPRTNTRQHRLRVPYTNLAVSSSVMLALGVSVPSSAGASVGTST